MADELNTGIRLFVDGISNYKTDMGAAKTANEEFETSADNAATASGKLDDSINTLAADSKSSGTTFEDNMTAAADNAAAAFMNIISVILEVNAAIIANANEIAEKGDKIAKGAQQLRFTTQAYQEWDWILKKNNSSMARAASAIQNLTRASDNASDKQVAAFGAIGLSMDQVQSLNPEQLFAAVVTGLQGIEDAGQRAAIASALFGSGYKSLGTLLTSSADETEDARQQANKLGQVMSDEVVQSCVESQDALENLNATLDGIKTNLGQGILPALTTFREGLTKFLTEDVDWEAVNAKISGLFDALTTGASWLVENADAVVHAVELVGAGWAAWKGTEVVMKTLESLKQIYGFLGLIGNGIGVSGLGVMGGAGLVALGVSSYASYSREIDALGKIGDGHNLSEYAENVTTWSDALAAAEASLAEQGGRYGPDVDEALQDAVARARIGLAAAQQEYDAAAANAEETQGTNEGAVESAAAAGEALAETSATLAENSAAMLDEFSSTAGEISTEFVEGSDEMSKAAVQSVEDTNDAMATNMAILSANAYVWGDDMMRSLANGILSGSISYVSPAISSVAQDIESLIGFSEPERGPLSRFHEFAPDMMRLFAQGILDNRKMLQDVVGSSFDLGPLIGAHEAGRTFNAGGVSVVIYASEGQRADELYDVFSMRLQHEVAAQEAVFST